MNKRFDFADMLFITMFLFLFILSNYAGHKALQEIIKNETEVVKVNIQNVAYAQKLMLENINQTILVTQDLIKNNCEISNQLEIEKMRRENMILKKEINNLKSKIKHKEKKG